MKSAKFVNFTDHEFVGSWDGKVKKFAPKQEVWMPDYLAKHFAKHLVNLELLRTDENGKLLIKDGDKMTSPKYPEQFPTFMELFNRAFVPDNETEELGDAKDDIDTLIDSTTRNREERAKLKEEASKPQDPTKPQVVLPPDFDEDDKDETPPQVQ